MAYFLLIFVAFTYLMFDRYFTNLDIQQSKFIKLILLVVCIWSIESIITPESCKCQSNSLLFASLLSLGFMLLIDFVNKKILK
jgi:hypothetical protein